MGIDCGLFCDTCKEFVNLGEWLFGRGVFQRNSLLFEFLTDHENHTVFFFMDVSDAWLDREYDKQYTEHRPMIVDGERVLDSFR